MPLIQQEKVKDPLALESVTPGTVKLVSAASKEMDLFLVPQKVLNVFGGPFNVMSLLNVVLSSILNDPVNVVSLTSSIFQYATNPSSIGKLKPDVG